MFFKLVLLSLVGTALAAPYEIVEVITVYDESKFPAGDVQPANANITSDDVKVGLPFLKFYNFGFHYKGERYVGEAHDVKHWPTKQNVQMYLSFMCQNPGDIINYVEIVAWQSSNEGRAWIVSGGIGQHYINIIMVAEDTTMLGYQGSIYAVNTK